MKNTWWVDEAEMKDEQLSVVRAPLEESILILGPPGSGKTNLLLLRAKYLTLAQQSNLQVVVFTKTLQSFIAAGGQQYRFPQSKIVTSRMLFHDLLRQYGKDITLPPDFEKSRLQLITAVKTLVEERNIRNIYDALLVDEAHDYLPEEIVTLRRLCKVFFAVADPRQQIYKAEGSIQALKDAVDKEYLLTHHFRNGLSICRVADAIAKDSTDYSPLTSSCNYDETQRKSYVECFREKDLNAQIEKIINKLQAQMVAYPDELLGVLCPRVEEVAKVWDAISKSPLANVSLLHLKDTHDAFASDKNVCISTIHAAKGLEFRALHLASAEDLKKFPYARNLAFTAVTRAKTGLSVYHAGDLHGFLEKALAVNSPARALPKVKDLFTQ